jgi:hypothetical protein
MIIFVPIYIFVLIPLFMIYSGFVLSLLWQWFAVGIFGMQPISIPEAIGVSLLIGYLAHQMTPGDEREAKDKLIESVAFLISKPTIFLLVGWVVSLWVK